MVAIYYNGATKTGEMIYDSTTSMNKYWEKLLYDCHTVSVLTRHQVTRFRAPDKIHRIDFNQHFLHHFFTKSYVLPLIRIVSMRRF